MAFALPTRPPSRSGGSLPTFCRSLLLVRSSIASLALGAPEHARLIRRGATAAGRLNLQESFRSQVNINLTQKLQILRSLILHLHVAAA